MKSRSNLFAVCFAAFALAWGSVFSVASAEPPQPSPALAAIQAGADFDVPLVVTSRGGAKSVLGRGHVNGAPVNILRVYWAEEGKVCGPVFFVLISGPGPQPGPAPTPTPTPTPQPGPQPTPQPGPQPTPQPGPIVKPTRVILLYETKNAPVKIAAVATSKAWKDEAQKLGMVWSVSDPDPIADTYPNLVGAAKKRGLPVFVFLDEARTILLMEKCPDSVDAATALIRKTGGGKP